VRFEPPSAEGATLRADTDEPAAQEPPRSRVTRTLTVLERMLVRRETGPVAGIVILAVIFQVASSGGFLTTNELSGVVTLGAPLSIISVGVCVLMISGEYDLSVAGNYAIAPIVMGKLMIEGWNGWLAFGAAMGCGLVVGLFNGLVTTRFGIPSLITTLAALYILQGLAYDITNGQTVLQFGHSAMFSIFGGAVGGSFLTAVILWGIGLAAALWVLLQHTRYGNWVFAAGDRNNAGRAMGVPTKRVKVINFVICAMLAAFAGCLQFSSFGGASPGNGSGYELLAIVSCVIGGTSLFGVKGTVIGAFIGALTVSCLQTGLVLIGAPGNAYESLIGVILVVTVVVNQQIAGSHGLARRVAPWLAVLRRSGRD
jgi:simple sugar transport system permease protein